MPIPCSALPVSLYQTWFYANKDYPYPDKAVKSEFSNRTGMSVVSRYHVLQIFSSSFPLQSGIDHQRNSINVTYITSFSISRSTWFGMTLRLFSQAQVTHWFNNARKRLLVCTSAVRLRGRPHSLRSRCASAGRWVDSGTEFVRRGEHKHDDA